MPTVTRSNPVPAFRQITITLNSLEEAQALKVLCTDTAKRAVSAKRNLALSNAAIAAFADDTYRALKALGVQYLAKNN